MASVTTIPTNVNRGGTQTITTQTQLPSIVCEEVVVQNHPDSVNNLIILDSTGAQTIVLEPKDSVSIEIGNANGISVVPQSGSVKFTYLARSFQ